MKDNIRLQQTTFNILIICVRVGLTIKLYKFLIFFLFNLILFHKLTKKKKCNPTLETTGGGYPKECLSSIRFIILKLL